MKKLTELNEFETKLSNNITDTTLSLQILIQDYVSKIEREYKENLYEIIFEICTNENLDFETIKRKYIKKKDLDKKKEENMQEETLLCKIIINNENYYYEHKENGIVYDNQSNQVGIYKNGEIEFDESN